MKKFTLQLLFLFISLSGYSQMPVEGFESTTGPDALPSTNWTLPATSALGNWAVFDNGVGTIQRWGINAFAASFPYQGSNCASVSREQIGIGNTSQDYLATPHVHIPANGELHFFTRMFTSGNQGTIYQVRVAPAATAVQTDPAAYTQLAQQWTEADMTTTYNVYEEKIVDLSAWANQDVYVSFVKVFTQPTGNIDGDRWLIDNVSINSQCLVPTGLVSTAITQNGASLNWANPSGATSWEIEIVLATATPTGTGTVYSGALPYVVTGLLANTTYKYYVRALCSTGYTSAWSAVSPTFTTGTAPPVCGGNFVDSGGATGSYSASENITTTICPSNPGDQVTVTFTSYSTENNFDFLKVYDGDNASATLLANLTGTLTTLPSYTSSAVSGCLTFVFTSDSSVNNAGWVANITCTPPPTCPKPTALLSSAVTSNAATFSWTNNGPATAWQVLALPCGSPAPTPTSTGWIDSPTTSFTFTGLSSATCYDLYVRGVCSATDSSLWAGPISVTTQLAPPVCGGNFVDTGGTAANYSVSENVTTTICPTVSGDKVTVTFTSFFTEATWDGLYVYNGNSVTPAQLLPSANPAGNVPGALAGSYWGNLTGANLPGPFTSTSADGCLTFVFRSDGSVTDPGWISTITCAPPPTCQQPTNLTATNFTTTSAQLGWVSPGTATTWQVLALPSGSPAPTAGSTGWTAAASNPFVLTGLTPGTAYDYYVRGDCGALDGVSLWSGPKAFSTVPTCPPPTTLTTSNVLSTSAQLNWNTVTPSVSWQILALACGSPAPTATSTGWIDAPTNPFVVTGLTPSTCYDFYVRGVCSSTDISFWSPVSTVTTQVAPPVCGGTFVDPGGPSANYANSTDSTVTICPNTVGDVVTVTFTSFFTESNYDGLLVYDGNSTNAPQLASTNGPGNLGLSTLPGSYWGNLTGANLPGPFTSSSSDGCLTFRFISDPSVNNPGWVANVTCSPAPACPKPNTLTATQITTTSALLGWTELNPNVTQWQVYLVLQGQPAPLPTTTTGWVTVSTNPALFSGLTSGTQYTYYVRSICPDGSTSLWSTAHNFSTLIINDECSGALFAPVNSSAGCGQITGGTLTGATASSVPLAAPCVGSADDDVWFQFIATNSYLNVSLQNIVGSTTNLNFAAYSGTCGTLTQVFCSAANANSGVINNLTVGQTYYIRVYSNIATPATVTFNLCISTPSTCPTASTACGLTGYANTTGVTSLGTIGCLFTSPNPAYFTIQVATSGAINYTLTQSTQPPVGGVPGPANIDVDYAAWGPFTGQDAACAFIGNAQPFAPPGIGVPVTQLTGCSYSAAPTETLNIANAVAGQYYIILITNFSNQPGYITLQQNNLPDPTSPPPGVGTPACCPSAVFTYNPVTYCKEAGAVNPVAIIATGAVAGVFTSSPAGLVFANTATGQVDLAASAPGSYIVTNTVAATATCTEVKTSTSTIQIVEPVTASFTYDPTITSYCNVLYTTPQSATLTGATGGTFSASPNGGLFLDVTTGAFTPSLSSPGVYTVTYSLPGTGSCIASNPSATVTIIDAPVPTFAQVAPICPGDALADLPTSSNDSPPITGTWSPAINNTQTTTYTFTPDAGQCSRTTTMTISVGSTTPTFAAVAAICQGATLAPLPTTSLNGITGTWSPALDNTQTTTYTFTPTSGGCVGSTTLTIQVLLPTIVPTFNAVPPICPNGIITALPTTSLNGITGVWSPAIDNTQTTTYTFTPDTGQCGLTTTSTVVVNPQLVVSVNNPTFCPGSSATVVATPAIPGTYTYTWTVPPGVTDPGNVASFTTTTPGTYTVVIDQVSSFCNTDFESPVATGTAPNLVSETLVPCWDTTAADGIIEIWPPGFEGVTAYSGNQLVELNANTPGTLFQDFLVIPGTTISVSFAHRGRQGNDVAGVEIGPIGGPYVSLGNFTDGNTAWGYHTVNYTIPTTSGNNYTLRFVSVSSTGGNPSVGNLLDDISISSLSCTSAPATGVVSLQTLPDPTVTVTDPTCSVQTGTIDVTSPLNSGGLPSNLFISEVTDEDVGSLTYVEIYNGTGATVDLSNYKLKVYNNGSSTASCNNQLAGMLNNNSTWVVAVGSTTNQGGVTPNQVFAGCGGVNIDDNIRLTTSTDVEIDLWGRTDGVSFTPSNQPGYTYRRLNTASVPSLVWNPADWTALDPQDYTNVGSFTSASSTYEYSLDNGTYQSSTTFSSVATGNHTITVHNLVTGCYSLPFSVTVGPIVGQLTTVTTISYTTPVCQNAATPELPDTSAAGFTSGGTYSEITSTGLSINPTTGEINLAASTVGIHTVQYEVLFNATTCQAYGVSTFVVEIKAVTTAVAGFNYTTPICKIAQPTLSPNLDPGFTTGGIFSSTTGLTINGTTGVIDLTNSTAGPYTVTYTAPGDVSICQLDNIGTFNIVINAATTPPVGFHYDSPVCAGQTTNPMPILDAGFTTGGLFGPTPLVDTTTGEVDLSQVTAGQQYTVTYALAANPTTCQTIANSSATIMISAPVLIEANGACQSVSFILHATVNGTFDPATTTFTWHNAQGVTVGDTQEIIATATGTYTVTVTIDGCDNVSAPFTVDSISCVIQKGISVNNDGFNDTFDLTGFDVKKLTIFNRLGMKVYSQSNYVNEWGGKSDNGDELPDGTYFYVIDKNAGDTVTGWIYINRAQ